MFFSLSLCTTLVQPNISKNVISSYLYDRQKRLVKKTKIEGSIFFFFNTNDLIVEMIAIL